MFSKGGGEALAKSCDVPFLGKNTVLFNIIISLLIDGRLQAKVVEIFMVRMVWENGETWSTLWIPQQTLGDLTALPL